MTTLKALALTLAFLVAFSHATVWNGEVNTSWHNTTATKFTISTPEQLAGIAQLVNKGTDDFSGDTILLANDIQLNDTTDWKDWQTTAPANSWTAIGIYADGKKFNGTFDGAGYVVSGLYINNNSDYQGLFGRDNTGAVIKNVGVVAGYVKGGGNVGGLVGYNDCGTISNSYAFGNVSGADDNVGGLVGRNYSIADGIGTISNSYAFGNVSGTDNNIGGLVGATVGTISNSYASGNVSGRDYVGGLAGTNSGGTISNSYASGNVSGGSSVGGLVGYNFGSSISNSYVSGNVSGTGDYVGGLVGRNYYEGTTSNSYYDSETSWQNDNDGKGIPKTTAEMKQQATFEGWDFDDIWVIDEGMDYPKLRSFSDGETPIAIPSLQNIQNSVTIQSNAVNLQVKNFATLEFYTLNGAKIRSLLFAGGVYSVPLNALSKGLYIVKASFGSERKVKKVMVK